MDRRSLIAGAALGISSSVAAIDQPEGPLTLRPVAGRNSKFSLDVIKFGAVGNGKVDDTLAFQTALDTCRRQGGGIVAVPPGRYLIKRHLVIPKSVTLEGIFCAPPSYRPFQAANGTWNAPGELTGSVLLAVEGAGNASGVPFISLNSNSVLKGMMIYYPDQRDDGKPIPYPWTVAVAEGGADSPAIVDVLMVNPYQAVDFGSYASDRLLIRNLKADALHRGIYIDNCLDTGRLENVHLWAFWQQVGEGFPLPLVTTKEGIGFIIGRTDYLMIQNCFAASYAVGFHFIETSPSGLSRGGPSPVNKKQIEQGGYKSGNAILLGGGVDFCKKAILVDAVTPHEGIIIANGKYNGNVEIASGNRGQVRIASCSFFNVEQDPAIPFVKSAGGGRVTFSDCTFNSGLNQTPRMVFVHATEGRIGVSNCTFESSGFGGEELKRASMEQVIVLERDVKSAVIVGNEFSERGIVENSAAGKCELSANVFEVA